MKSSIELLQQLIRTPSFSGEEGETTELLFNFLASKGVNPKRDKNNVWACNLHYQAGKPTLLLNSHHDTVRPSSAYTRNPFEPTIEDGKLYGLGSNDAGGPAVALLEAFCRFYAAELPFNIVIAITAEEEAISLNGITDLLPKLGKIDFAIVGEPTLCQGAIAERGLLVLDCLSHGVQGHAARNEGDNALYHAIDDIQWFRTFQFPKESAQLGKVKMTVTQLNAGTQHNVIPGECHFVVDVRPTDAYTNSEIVDIVRAHVQCEVTPRSLRAQASAINETHILVQAAKDAGLELYVSPTTSDIARIQPMPALKCGPGNSARSHSADEFICIHEIEEGIATYERLLNSLCKLLKQA